MKFTIKNSKLIKITAETKLKIGDTIKTALPSSGVNGPTIITIVRDILQGDKHENFIKIKVDGYDGYFDIGYVKNIL